MLVAVSLNPTSWACRASHLAQRCPVRPRLRRCLSHMKHEGALHRAAGVVLLRARASRPAPYVSQALTSLVCSLVVNMDDLENGTPWFSQFQQATSSSNAAESLLWILSDSNLPTGGFVASAGLESFFAHGFLHDVGVPIIPGFSRVTANNGKNASSNTSSADRVATSTASFLYLSLSSYARTALPFIMDVHAATSAFLQRNVALKSVEDDAVAGCVSQIERFDQAYHSMTLNHVLRRASKAQGIALLTLYSKSFAQDLDMGSMWTGESETEDVQERDTVRSDRAANLMSELKRKIRKAASRDETPFGHLPICWAAFCAALDIPIGECERA